MNEKCWLYDGCKSRTAACISYQPIDDGCPVYRWFKKVIMDQEAVVPKLTQGHIGSPIWQCGKCGSWIGNEMVLYCWHCGRKVKWK